MTDDLPGGHLHPNQPDGIDEQTSKVPNPNRAAARVEEFLRWYGDGRIELLDMDEVSDPPLYSRDLEALRRLAEVPAGGQPHLDTNPTPAVALITALRKAHFADSDGDCRGCGLTSDEQAHRAGDCPVIAAMEAYEAAVVRGKPQTPQPDGPTPAYYSAATVPLWCDVCSQIERFTPAEAERIIYVLHGETVSAQTEPDGDRIHAGEDWRTAVTCYRGDWLPMSRMSEGYAELVDGWVQARQGGEPVGDVPTPAPGDAQARQPRRDHEQAAAARLADYLATRATTDIPGTLIHTIPGSQPLIAARVDDISTVLDGLFQARCRQDLYFAIMARLWTESGRAGRPTTFKAAKAFGVSLAGFDSCGLTRSGQGCGECAMCRMGPAEDTTPDAESDVSEPDTDEQRELVSARALAIQLRLHLAEAIRQGNMLIAERDRARERLAARDDEAENYQIQRDRAHKVPDEVTEHLLPVVGGDWIGRPDPAELARAAALMLRHYQHDFPELQAETERLRAELGEANAQLDTASYEQSEIDHPREEVQRLADALTEARGQATALHPAPTACTRTRAHAPHGTCPGSERKRKPRRHEPIDPRGLHTEVRDPGGT
jgi:hypothetical protein